MITDETTLKRIKAIELEILVSFIDCCERLGLNYYLMDGTLLGAVRHKGFIPWDDDIDVGMIRNDYEAFIENCQGLLPDQLFLQTFKTDPEVLLDFAKIRDSRTTFIETSYKDRRMNHGIYIDIFPLDYYPEEPNKQRSLDIKKRINNLRIRREFNLPFEVRGSDFRERLKALVGEALKIKYPTALEAVVANDYLYKSVKKSNYYINQCGAYGRRSVVPIEWFGEGVSGSFEGITVSLPKEYDLYLKRIYGDYMQLPPEEKRISHHYTEIIDTNKPYTAYIR